VHIAWNDLEILRIVDECDQGKRSGVFDGCDLMRIAAEMRDQGPASLADQESFVRELLILNDAELLTWQVMSSVGLVTPISPDDPNDYLQNIHRFSLTYEGRNQARGRVVQAPLLDPEEDDGRPIASLTLEDVARCIERRYDAFQAIQLLVEGGISGDREPPEAIGTATGLLMLFLELCHGVSVQRRELRSFLGAWLDDELHMGPSDDERERIVSDLARQGWFAKHGRLVVGETVRRDRSGQAPTPATYQLHPLVWNAAETRWKTKHLHDAVIAASKAVNALLQTKLGRSDVSEVKLVQSAFSSKPATTADPRLRFPDVADQQTRYSLTAGVLQFGVGCFMAMRNPIGHRPDDEHKMTEQEASEQLAVWSLFARWIDRAAVTTTE
jgi:uncharacterized protein (TIGR02391 family)